MSLSPFDSFQSRFVTYLLNFPRRYLSILHVSVTVFRSLNNLISAQLFMWAKKNTTYGTWNAKSGSRDRTNTNRLQL